MTLRHAPLLVAAALACMGSAAAAMTLAAAGDQLIMTGLVAIEDRGKAAAILDAHPEITTLVLRNSSGGDTASGYSIGEMIRARGLRTAVSGYCYSSCSRLFLGGKERLFTDDYPAEATAIGLHGHYNAQRTLNRRAVARRGLKAWILRYSDGKADAALVERWISIPVSRGLIYFYRPSLVQTKGAATFLCQGAEPDGVRPFGCERIDRTALDVGIVTSLDPIGSNDRQTLPTLTRDAAPVEAGEED
jgi:hypothetical protein